MPEPDDDDKRDLSWLAYFGQELQLARKSKDLTVRALAVDTSYSYQQIHNVETGRRTPSEAFAREIDEVFGTGGRFMRILKRILLERLPVWYQGAVREEAKATRLRIFQPHAVPGLLQNPDYARGLMKAARPWLDAESIDAEVAARVARQDILRRSKPPLMWIVLDEAVLLHPIGGCRVFADQLERLIAEAEAPAVILQVLPVKTQDHPALDGGFTIWSYSDRADVLYSEGMLSATIVERSEDVATAHVTYDLLQALALPPGEASLQVIRRALKDYT